MTDGHSIVSSTAPRSALRDARRIVVKIGSRSLVEAEGRFALLSKQLQAMRDRGCMVVLVSSGAIALGIDRLELLERPGSIAGLQAVAAVGQTELMRRWEHALAECGMASAQVLLTHADLSDRDRYLHVRSAIDAMLDLQALPIINENDTVGFEEIRFGDNDQLAAMVATLVGADLLLLLTHTEGLLDAENRCIPLVQDIEQARTAIRPEKSTQGSGGMASKVDAAVRATRRGVPVVVASASEREVLTRIVDGDRLGTLFLPAGAPMASRKHWIAYTLRSKGRLFLDAGAIRAVVHEKRSLLPAGVVAVRGDFEPGDAVDLCTMEGIEVA
ncbi:MAG: glutamate 5-kinase, partial [Myxococcota bacterium]